MDTTTTQPEKETIDIGWSGIAPLEWSADEVIASRSSWLAVEKYVKDLYTYCVNLAPDVSENVARLIARAIAPMAQRLGRLASPISHVALLFSDTEKTELKRCKR